MHTYAATYITGLGDLVENALTHDIADIQVVGKDDGLIVFKTTQQYEQLLPISYVNNMFYSFIYESDLGNEKSVHAIVKLLVQKTSFMRLTGKTFRLMVMHGSKLEHVTKEIANKMKEKISKQTGLVFSPLKADVEFWVLVRNDGAVMFGYKRDAQEQKMLLEKGELRPKIAELLVMASKPEAEDVFLDPFAGYGSIPAARIRMETYSKIILVEKKGPLVEGLKRRFKKERNVMVQQGNSLELSFLKDKSIDVIVTDPPWGLFEEIQMDLPVFYTKMVEELSRVIKQEGRIVILTGQPEAMEVALLENPTMVKKTEYTTLVNGKKATVFVISPAQAQMV